MKIQYTEFAANPALRGTIANHPAHVAQVLIAQGAAVEIKPKTIAEFLDSKNPPAQVPTVEWGIKNADERFSCVTIIKRFGNETTIFREPPQDCPAGVAAQWREMGGTPSPAANPQEKPTFFSRLASQISGGGNVGKETANVLEAAHRNQSGDGHAAIHTHTINGKRVYLVPGKDFPVRD
jgi:hypothetical protein